MDLQEMLGDAYHEGMTIEEINSALSDKKFVDLSTGQYVDKNKYNADLKAKDAEIQAKAKELSDKMTEDEKAVAEQAEKDAMIEDLKKQIREGNIKNSKAIASSSLNDVRNILGIKEDDKSFNDFIGSISNEDSDATKTLTTYINKLVKDSYEKGKEDASKDNMGIFSKDVSSASGNKNTEVGKLGKELAQSLNSDNIDPDLYFKNNK